MLVEIPCMACRYPIEKQCNATLGVDEEWNLVYYCVMFSFREVF